MKRVLQISIGDKVFGGVENIIYGIYKHIDKEKIQFDFLSPKYSTYESVRKEITEFGGKIYELGISRDSFINKIKYAKALKKFLKENKYEIVHINSGVFLFDLQVAIVAKKAKVKTVIVHSHSNIINSVLKQKIINILKPILYKLTDEHLACSKQAALALYPLKKVNDNEIKYISNGIEIYKYIFNEEKRYSLRKKMNIENCTVYGSVGRFYPEKNHSFLIDTFKCISDSNENARLLLIGTGPLEQEIKNKIKELKIEDKVIVTGFVKNVNEYLNAMDVFILPSKYEGLGIVLIEAQTNGLPCVCSDKVPDEAKISKEFIRISLNESNKYWAEKIIKIENNSNQKRNESYINTINNNYDIKDTVKIMEEIYLMKENSNE